MKLLKTREDVEKVKPDPALYQIAIEDLGIDPSEAVVFEDSLNGLKAAIAAGLTCVVVPNDVTRNLPFANHHLRIESMKDKKLERSTAKYKERPYFLKGSTVFLFVFFTFNDS